MSDTEAFAEREATGALVLDADSTVLYLSAALGRECGHGASAMVGDDVREYLHPDDRGRFSTFVRPSEDGRPFRYRLRHADGSWVWFEAVGRRRLGDDCVVRSRTVTALDGPAQTLERFETILESLDDAVYAIDSEGTLVYVNERYAAMKGVAREAMLGTDVYSWADGEAVERIRAARRKMNARGESVGTVEFGFSTVDGGTVPVEMRFSTVSGQGADLERVGVLRDVSEQKARERALRRKNERLEEFASVVSHDLRNPLNVAEGWVAEVRAECDGDGDGDDALDRVAAAHDRMGALIDDLLTLAREGRDVDDPDAVDLAAALRRAWETVETEDATLVVDADGVVRADESRLRQLLENLVRNAVEHGGADVTVTVGDLEDGFFLEDDGPGIPAETRAEVFDLGYSTTTDGTGFGLGIVEEIAEAHGWTVHVAEGTAGGARFEVTGVDAATGAEVGE
jgi:PAS domain S-box-containing protein